MISNDVFFAFGTGNAMAIDRITLVGLDSTCLIWHEANSKQKIVCMMRICFAHLNETLGVN